MKKIVKKTTSLFLIVAMLLSVTSILSAKGTISLKAFAVWDGSSYTEPNSVDGIYQISNESELAWFASSVNSGNTSISAKLLCDIDLGDTTWIQIGSANAFAGEFDGNEKTVTYCITNGSAIYQGFFNTVDTLGIVKNLKVCGSVSIKGSRSGRNYHGGIVGFNKGTVSNCVSEVDFSIAGTAGSKNNVKYVGGIAGKNSGKTENCINNGDINITSYAAGIIGENIGGNVIGCKNNGSITVSNVAGYAGGIVAAVTANASDNKMLISNCVNSGTITGGSGDYGYAAGIIAQENVASSFNTYDSMPELKIEGCKNSGELTSVNTADIIAKQSGNCKIEIVEETEPSPTPEDQQAVEDAISSLGEWFKLIPTYGQDTNVIDIIKNRLEENGITDVNVSIKSTDDPSCISESGEITYFFEDPDSWQVKWFNSVPLVFVFEKNGAEAEYSINAVIHWDQDRVKDYLEANILSKVTDAVILNGNISANEVTDNLLLPKVVDDKKWTLISWESSDNNCISIDSSNQSTADTLFEPYIGVVKRGDEDKTVTLTASFDFRRTSDDEAQIVLTKTFEFTVKAASFGVKEEMQEALDSNYTADKLKVFGTERPVEADNITDDIQLVIPSKTGIQGYDNYRFTVKSSNSDIIEINAYRAVVFRPLPGEAPAEVTLTVFMTSKQYDITVSKDFNFTVQPLTQDIIDNEIALMEKVKESYFVGINNGANEDSEHVKNNLSSFTEARYSENSDSIEWVYSYADKKGNGIIPVSIDETHPSEQWDKFFTTDNNTVSYENLLVTRSSSNKTVTISSCLSSETFAKYAEKYPENKDFSKLYRQNVSVTVVVLGTKGTPVISTSDAQTNNGAVIIEPSWLSYPDIKLSCSYDAEYSSIVWSSNNDKVTVDSDGNVSCNSIFPQSATITARILDSENNIISEAEIEVKYESVFAVLFRAFADFLNSIKVFILKIFALI